MAKIVELEIKDVVIPQGFLPRVLTGTVEEKVEEYKELLEEGVEFDPILVWEKEDGQYWVIDGVHRIEAHKRAGKERIKAKLVKCQDELDFRIKAIQANLKHGLALARGERPELARILYKQGLSEEEIRKVFGVSERTIERWLKPVKDEERQAKIKKAKELREKGWEIKDIAKELGINERTVYRYLQESDKNDTMAKLTLLLPSGAPTPEGLKLWSEYVEQADNLNDAFNESGFYSFLKNKGYEEAEYYGQFITTVREEIFTYVKKLVDAGMSETAIRTALSKENKGIFKHISSTAKAKLAGLLRDYIQNLVKKREQRQEEEKKILGSAKEILQDPQYVFSNWYNLAKEILNRLEEQGEYLRHRYTPRDISPILQQHSDELLRLYNSIPEVSEEELKEIVQSLNLGEFEDLRQLKETLRATVLQKGKRPAGVETFATELWNEYWSKKLKEDSPEESSPSQETLSDGTPLVRTYTDEQIEEMARAANEASEEIFEEKKEERKRGPKGPHPYKTEKPKTAEEELRQNTDWIKAHILWIIDKFGRKKAKEIVSEIYHDLETLPNSQLWKKWQIAYAYAHSKLGIRSYEYWKDEV